MSKILVNKCFWNPILYKNHYKQLNFNNSYVNKLLRNNLRFIYTSFDAGINGISGTGILNTKHFVQFENQYAHDVLKDKQVYNIVPPIELLQSALLTNNNTNDIDINTITPIISEDYNLNGKTTIEILNDFYLIAKYCRNNSLCLSHNQFDDFTNKFTENINRFTDDDLIKSIQILNIFPEVETIEIKNFSNIWHGIDDECLKRLPNWNVDKILLVCDHWYEVRLAKICSFVWESFRKIERRVKSMTPTQLVQTMFYCNLVRKPLINMIDIEKRCIKIINKLSIDEIAIMSIGFFKTQHKIQNKILIYEIYERLINEIKTIRNMGLVSIIKVLRYSSGLSEIDIMTKLLDKLTIEIPRLNLLSCLHISLLGSEMQCCHKNSLELIVQRFYNELSDARLKDMERICFIISLYDFETKSKLENKLLENIMKELKIRINEIVEYPRPYVNCLHYLSLKGYADNELISSALDSKFLSLAYGRNLSIGQETFQLDTYTRINLNGQYNGNQLSDEKLRKMGKILVHYVPEYNSGFSLSHADRMTLEVKDTLELLSHYPVIIHGLPQYERPESIIAVNKITKIPIDIKANYPENYSGKILYKHVLIPDVQQRNEIELIMIIIGGWNTIVRNQERPTGLLKQKMLQAQMIGYTPIMIPWYEWNKLTVPEHKIYLNLKLKPILKQNLHVLATNNK